MASKEYIERLQMVISHLHGSDSVHLESVPVLEKFRGKTAWRGVVEVFELRNHPKAKRCYAWSHADGPHDKSEKFVAVLGLPPVNSPKTAVQAAIVSEIKKQKL